MQRIDKPISCEILKKMAKNMFGDLVKAIVDIDKAEMCIDGSMHADLEKEMLDNGSQQEHWWDINLHPELSNEDWIEFDSLINLRPAHGNRTRGVDSPEIQKRIRLIVKSLVSK